MSKKRQLCLKPIFKRTGATFMFNDFEYTISRDMIYFKKFLGLKVFFFSIYIEGNPNPLEFKDRIMEIGDVPLNEIAVMMKLLKKTAIENIGMWCAIIGCILGGMTLYYVYQIAESMGI